MDTDNETLSTGEASGAAGAAAGGAAGAILLAGLFGLTGCATTLPISRLLEDPYEYAGDVVRVEGEVTEAAGALGRGVYALSDGTGVLFVVSEKGGVPRNGARVRVRGRVEPLFTFRTTTAAALLETDRDLP